MTDTRAQIDQIYREEYGRVVASLVRRFGDLDIAEDAASEALLAAVERWTAEGIPPNPGGWLTTTAGNRAIDRIRRESLRDAKHQAAMIIDDPNPHEATGPVDDDRLRLIFTCCHPALAPQARVALTLRLLGGLTVGEIARAFLVAETTMAQRITRAKSKIKSTRIPFRVPDESDVTDRVGGVLAVIYLIFNEGYLPGAGDDPTRTDLTAEAIRLGRMMRQLLPDDGEVAGLLALMLLADSRRAARVSNGELVPLDQQDRGGWDHQRIAQGHDLVRECLARVARQHSHPGQYQLMAAIHAVHTDARDARDTDWGQVVALYDQLYAVAPTPVVALNRAVAVAEVDGPDVALAIVGALALDRYHAWHAARADLLRRLGRSAEARQAYAAAIAATANPAERAYLTRRRDQLGS
ncbi:sigma-70 family RNA polymerase sigma factor [Gordonia sp. SID5947]|uniref:RNA polymerase sigma factor n=1 Tax=Gordonia sp. SID5947 TaxID=2690315 RepID=UPI001370C958|nr:sigma-70 family RNA polymerase sigma factor [Gordonia sp. SID5947]MYR07377.1 sigma-70 family RNA polymerase sigma factor [Gordonia sp. SID5947]